MTLVLLGLLTSKKPLKMPPPPWKLVLKLTSLSSRTSVAKSPLTIPPPSVLVRLFVTIVLISVSVPPLLIPLVLSRQNLPIADRGLYAGAEGLLKGAYILSREKGPEPDVVLM